MNAEQRGRPQPGRGTLDQAREWLADADRLLLTAGAGLSAAAGYDYGDTERFAQLFPALYEIGFRARYELIGAPLPPTALWGFWAVHTADIRFSRAANPLYDQLRRLVGDRDHYVMTSNVDALFTRHGFDSSRVFTPQGDYGLYQCATPCTRQVWDSWPVIERALRGYDPTTGTIANRDVPLCTECGGKTYLNVNTGTNFIRDHFLPVGRELDRWLVDGADSRLVVLEIGAGLQTPGVIRWPDEQLVRALPSSRLIRVNPELSEVPADLAERSASLTLPADQAIDGLA